MRLRSINGARIVAAICAVLLPVGAALAQSETACKGATGDCCTAHTEAGCGDAKCCAAVCAVDPFCCDTQWDSICVGQAMDMCVVCRGSQSCPGPACNYIELEPCGEFTNGGCQSSGFETISVSTVVCGTFWLYANATDVDWYSLTIEKETRLTITLYAEGASHLYLTDENCGKVFAADEEGCPLSIVFCAAPGTYRVLAERYVFGGSPCGSEMSDYTLEVLGEPCSTSECGNSRQDCLLAGTQPACSNAKCCHAVCAVDPFCCNTAWDQICADEANQFTECLKGDPSCGFEPGECCEPHGGTGCLNLTCCESVCGMDPYCCQVEWDEICVAEAHDYFEMECCCFVDWYCPGDFNSDLMVDGADLGMLLANWGNPPGITFEDLNFDGQVDGADLGILLGVWGKCKPPCEP